ncbi:MAG: hypothetical protein ABSA59_00125, partial [Terriglobia bacterium]
QAPNRALTALGEDPEEYAGLMNSLENNLVEGLEDELKQRIGHAFWRMRRAERVQDGLALKRIKTAHEIHKIATQPQLLRAHQNLERYEQMATALRRRGHGPTPAEIQAFVRHFDDDPSEEMKEFFVLLKSLDKLEEGPERKAALRKARAQVCELEERYRRVCVKFAEQLDEMQSPEDLAALTAPQDEKSLLMQRMEDSSLRQLWRLTNMLFRVRNGALTPRDVKNEDRPGYAYENKGDDDKMSGEKHGFLHENAAIEG